MELMEEVTSGEVDGIIKSMPKYNSLGADGWIMELFQHFFEIVGSELTEVVKILEGKVQSMLLFNSCFISLIPKKVVPSPSRISYLSPYVNISTKL